MSRLPNFQIASWRNYPWLLGLLLAPLLFGSVNPDGQAIVAGCFAVSLFFFSPNICGRGWAVSINPPVLNWLAVGCLLFPLLPLPIQLMGWINPERVALARAFPIEAGVTSLWLPTTISPAASFNRLWEVLIIVTVFCVARYSAAHSKIHRPLVLFLGAALLLLSLSDIWFRWDGQRKLLGIWPNSAGHAAGTFANRNHFANWIYVAILFCAGWVLRSFSPLQSARLIPRKKSITPASFFLLVSILISLVMAVLTGSRGGIFSFLIGIGFWILFLSRHSRNRIRWLGLSLVGLVALILILVASDYLLGRLGETISTKNFKVSIWKDSFRLIEKFPLFGTGLGTFFTAFNHFKTFGGESSFLHTENDYLQALVENGLIATFVFGFLLFRIFRRAFQFAWEKRHEEPELVLGAVSALAVFLTHACFEFVFQITADALLAATLLGYVIGCRDRSLQPAVLSPPGKVKVFFNLSWALVLFLLAGLQGAAWWHWRKALHAKSAVNAVSEIKDSLRWWPFNNAAQIALVRTQVRLLVPPARDQILASEIRHQLQGFIRQDPLNWELRFERAWYDAVFSTNAILTRQEAWEVVRLNPLQPHIPLRFAGFFRESDPDLAMAFVRATPNSRSEILREKLTLAWQIENNSAALWALTSTNVPDLKVLADFALGQQLFSLAATLFQRLGNEYSSESLAEKFLKAQRPDLAVEILSKSPSTPSAKLLLCQANIQLQQYPEAIRVAESVWRDTPFEKTFSYAEVDARLHEIVRQPAMSRDLVKLKTEARQSPKDLSIQWLVFQTELELHRYAEAAETALNLATKVTTLGK